MSEHIDPAIHQVESKDPRLVPSGVPASMQPEPNSPPNRLGSSEASDNEGKAISQPEFNPQLGDSMATASEAMHDENQCTTMPTLLVQTSIQDQANVAMPMVDVQFDKFSAPQIRKDATTAVPPLNHPLKIYVTGDVFWERFLWPAVDSPTTAPLPYTWPDELRTSPPTVSFRELSGAPLHAKIIEAFLTISETSDQRFPTIEPAKGQQPISFKVEAKPDHSPHTSLIEDSYGPYPVYLHRLGPFPVSKSNAGRDESYVWRIKESFGNVQIATKSGFNPLADAVTEEAETWLTNIRDEKGPTIVVVNDRNVKAPGSDKSQTRSVFGTLLKTLPRNWYLIPDRKEGKPSDKSKNAESKMALSDNLLLIWHARQPFFEKDDVGDFLLKTHLSEVTIPIVNHHCLRDHGVALRFDSSYESTIRTLLDALTNETIKRLLLFPQVLIRFDYGILHLSADPKKPGKLIGLDIHGFNLGPYRLNSQGHGIMTGTTPLLVATIVREVHAFLKRGKRQIRNFLQESARYKHPTLSNSTPLDRAIDAALLLSGRHYYSGFGAYAPLKPLALNKEDGTLPVYKRLFKDFTNAVKYNDEPLSEPDLDPAQEPDSESTEVKQVDDSRGCYRLHYQHVFSSGDRLTRLSVGEGVLGKSQSAQATRAGFTRVALLDNTALLNLTPAFDHADLQNPGELVDIVLRKVVTHGLDQVFLRKENDGNSAVEGDKIVEPSILCPIVAFGNHLSMDWRDIDSFLAIRNLVEKYVSHGDFDQPLPIAAFGPPGSGKSFIIRQILSSIVGCKVFDDLVCNISQIKSPETLARHFHRVQDRSVKGDIPIVFFDEFDSPYEGKPVGWLRYFLMPLQDGLYVEGDETFDVGRAIFVFAGGIAHSFDEFCQHFGHIKGEKVPDFISRLRGFVNVQDIAFESSTSNTENVKRGMGVAERTVQLRRAILLRSIIQRRMPQIVDQNSRIAQIWPSIIDAFLNVSSFTHGVRSMEAIVQMSRVSTNVQSFQPSALPQRSQLNMHVQEDEFMRIVNEDTAHP